MDFDFRAISNRLYEALHRKYKSVTDFYKKRGEELGISLDTLKNHIRKSDEPPKVNSIKLEYLCIYAKEFNVSTDYLLFGDKRISESKEQITKNEVFYAIDTLIAAFGISSVKTTFFLKSILETKQQKELAENIDYSDEGNPVYIPRYFLGIKNETIIKYLELIYTLNSDKKTLSPVYDDIFKYAIDGWKNSIKGDFFNDDLQKKQCDFDFIKSVLQENQGDDELTEV